MESEDDDAFCHKSLKRIRANKSSKSVADKTHTPKNLKKSKQNGKSVEKGASEKKHHRGESKINPLFKCESDSEIGEKIESKPSVVSVTLSLTDGRSESHHNGEVSTEESISQTNAIDLFQQNIQPSNSAQCNLAAKKVAENDTRHLKSTMINHGSEKLNKEYQPTRSISNTISITRTRNGTVNTDISPEEHPPHMVETESDNLSEKVNCLNLLLAKNGYSVSVKDKDGGVVQLSETTNNIEEGRCPFCQMPFRALCGQSPNWHTMECMDIPLKTMEECPAGLACRNNIASHYRRYAHSKLALHLAGQDEEITHAGSEGGSGSTSLSRIADNTTCSAESNNGKRSDTQHKSPKSSSRPLKRKWSSLKSPSIKPTMECRGSTLSNSQGSESSCESTGSINAYFSPNGKKTAVSNHQNCQANNKTNQHETETDPVLRLLILSDSDSDSEENTNHISKGKKLKVEFRDSSIGSGPKTVHKKLSQNNKNIENENIEDLTKSNDEDYGSGFFLPQSDDLEPDEAAANSLVPDITTKTKTDEQTADSNQTSPSSLRHTFQIPSISTAPPGLRKQTSLFSFFKAHCHSASSAGQPQKPPALSVKSQDKNQTKEGRKRSIKTAQPSLKKSASEPVKVMRVPSPPPAVPVKRFPDNTTRPQIPRASMASVNVFTSYQNRSARQCPFYKKLPGTAITVDAFSYGEIPGCRAYVLTHFHYDHYQGLKKKFAQPIYCSPVTGNLVERQIGVDSRWLNRVPLNTPRQVAGVTLTLMEANHCPGAVIILFELPNGKKLLHTGDFRAHPCMEQYPPLVNISVDELYLDTTYCDPAYAFPSQKETIQFAVSTALKTVAQNPSTLIVCGSYTIGKERVFIAVAEALKSKVCVQSAKKRVLDCLQDDRLKDMLSLKWSDGRVHVLPMKQLNARGLEQHLAQCPNFSSVLAFEPTGWTHSNKALSLDNLRPKFSARGITIYGVPYSEHSSFLEMKRFVQFIRPKKILPTVNNGNPTSRRKMEAIFQQWMSEKISVQDSVKPSTQQSLGSWLHNGS